MAAAGKREMIEDLVLVFGLVTVQIIYAGNSVLLSYLLKLDLNPLTIVIFSTFVTFFVLSPPSIYLERSKWPTKFNFRLFLQLVLMSFGGVTIFQILFLKGIMLTSPAIATAMPNLAPGLIFIIAATFKLEKIKLSCIYSKVKIVSILLCVIGALTMSIMQSNSPMPKINRLSNSPISFDSNRIIGCIYLMAAVFILSCNIVLQAKTLVEFPAPISICAITSFIGATMTMSIELYQNHKLDFGTPQVINTKDLIGLCLLGGIIGGVSNSFGGWAMKKKGPVLVSMFTPISTVVSAIISFFTFGEVLSSSSLIGMMVMFMGLYMFLWAKSKEGFTYLQLKPISQEEHGVEKPLLS
ncbi:WAT1-related protein At5g47470-like [Impatiens glandulifera]|uniref:WAT1-related protein At5g47470-like n=1 Tax=Impatiens glandulifera TaxID=253017 RepID=UPI001FB120E2|nr:WAT1-related protein At5g47470-like [Impatiens glandulifera]